MLSCDPDANIAERAQNALLSQPEASFLSALARSDADARLFAYCADNLCEKPGVADAMAKNAACPTALVTRTVRQLTTEGIQALLDNLERVSSDPELAIALKQSQACNAEQSTLIQGIDGGPLSNEQIEDAAVDAEPDPVKRKTLLQRITYMNVVERLTLALKGGREERMLLIRDPNKLVQRSVLQSPRLTDTEVEAFAAMTNVSGEVLRTISLLRKFMKGYPVARNLINNPKTPLDISLHLLPRLAAPDLVKLTSNKNVPETLKKAATNLNRKRKMGLG
ncbi:MAG: hypothetical protein ACRD5R_17340 [Candidatus Acidiferrales bacterium]